jgi:hypothetical protein
MDDSEIYFTYKEKPGTKIFKVGDTLYADELYVSDQTYRLAKRCPFDNRVFPEGILKKTHYSEDIDWEAIHFASRIYCSGRIDLCGGNNIRGIVPTNFAFIISEAMKDNILANKFTGFSFYDITANPNQTQIENIRLFGVNAAPILIRPYESDLFENVSISCPSCNYQPLF